MTIINANLEPVNETILNQPTLWYVQNTNHTVSYNRVINQPLNNSAGNRLGGISAQLENTVEPELVSLPDLASCGNFSGFLLYVGRNHTNFGYQGSNTTADGNIAIFYDINQNFIKSVFAPQIPGTTPNDRYYFSGNFAIDTNVHFILFGGKSASFEIEEITLE